MSTPKKGRVKDCLEAKARALGLDSRALLQRLVNEGVTHAQIAEQLGCTRQGVGVIAKALGVQFPGAARDVDAIVRDRTLGVSFEDYYARRSAELTQEAMAAELGVSFSTLKRRIAGLRQEGA